MNLCFDILAIIKCCRQFWHFVGTGEKKVKIDILMAGLYKKDS